jgi:transcriptional regulator with GAF, ATPase, and Fis domain
VPDDDRTRLIKAMSRCNGNLTAMAKQLRVTRKTVWQWLKRHNLADEADALRAAAHVKGPRRSLVGHRLDPEGERAEIGRALAATGWRVDAAAKQLGMGRRTLTTLIQRYSLLRPVPSEAEERAALELALREGGGTQVGAARVLGCSHTQVQRRMKRLGVSLPSKP